MRLKMTSLLFNIVIIAYLISNCGNSPMDVANKGQLQMRISFAEEINKASTLRESAIIDQMRVTVSNSNGGDVAFSDLIQNGPRWEGEIELDPADDLTVTVEASENSVLRYAGSSSGVNVQADETVEVDITISNPAIYNIQLTPSSPESLRFNERVNIFFRYLTNETSGVEISGFPFSNSSLTLNWSVGSIDQRQFYRVGSGSGTDSFTITSGDATVDQIEFKMRNAADLNDVLKVDFLSVEYIFSQ